jgi:hypothetical protein
LELAPTDFLPEFDDPDVLLPAEEPPCDELDEPEELDELDELDDEELSLELDLAGSDLLVESDLSLEPLLSDFDELSAPSPLLLPAGTPPLRLSVR